MGCNASARKQDPPVLGPDWYSNYSEKKGEHYWNMHADSVAEIFFAKKGPASKEALPAMTVLNLLEQAVKKHGNRPALRVERVEDAKGNLITPPLDAKKIALGLPTEQWLTWNWAKYGADCNMAARALMSLGVPQFSSVAIYGFNSPEWFISQVSSMISGAKSAGIYPSDRIDNVVYKCKHSKAAVALVQDEGKLKRFQPVEKNGEMYNPLDDLPDLKHIVVWSPENELPKELDSKNGKVSILNWAQFMKAGEKTSVEDLKNRQAAIKPGHCCALIYTSGTTGRPKAVMISHDNIIFESSAIMGQLKPYGVGSGGAERILSYLPLSHVAGMMVDIIAPMYVTASRVGWCEAWFARPYDLSAGTVKSRLQAVKPTMFLGVPRVWEKIADKMKLIGATITGFKKKLSTWGKPKLLEYTRGFNLSEEPRNPSCLCIANKVAKAVKTNLGLTEVKYAFTGAAPIQKHTLEYFGSVGIMINEVYGMSECTGATTISTDATHEWGSCGFTLPGCEVAILKEGKDGKFTPCPKSKDMFNATEEEQGEICFRGRHIMMGYLCNPELKDDGGVEQITGKNQGAIDEQGWLHSGDKGCMSKKGMVKITGRYKELIIPAGGENVAPVPIESNIKKIQGAISNVMMVGDKMPFIIALVTLKVEGATGEAAGTNVLTKQAQLVEGVTTVEEAMNNVEYVKLIQKAIVDTNNDHTVCTKSASMIRKFSILAKDFSTSGGELTATLKLKRSVVRKQYEGVINRLYDPKLPKSTTYINFSEGGKESKTVDT